MKLELKGTNSYYFALITLLSAIRRYEKKILKEKNIDITPLMLSYIVVIYENKDVTSKDISELLGVSKGTLSTMIKTLTRKKYITTHVDPKDKRKQKLSVTPEGLKIVKLSNKIRNKFKNAIRQSVPAEKLEAILTGVYSL